MTVSCGTSGFFCLSSASDVATTAGVCCLPCRCFQTPIFGPSSISYRLLELEPGTVGRSLVSCAEPRSTLATLLSFSPFMAELLTSRLCRQLPSLLAHAHLEASQTPFILKSWLWCHLWFCQQRVAQCEDSCGVSTVHRAHLSNPSLLRQKGVGQSPDAANLSGPLTFRYATAMPPMSRKMSALLN